MPLTLAKFEVAWRRTDRFVAFVHIQLSVLSAIIHDQVDYYATSSAGTITGAIHFVGLYDSPLSAGSPILHKFVKGILRMILRMLLPGRIVIVGAVGFFEILFLQGRKELIGNVFLRPEAIEPANSGENQYKEDRRNEARSSSPFLFRVVLFGVE